MYFTGYVLPSLILIATLGGGHYDCPYVITEKADLERVRNLPGSHSWKAMELKCKPKSSQLTPML